MAYTKRFEVKVDGTKILWDIDMDGNDIKIKDSGDFELTYDQLQGLTEMVHLMVENCKKCPEVKSIEFSDIV